jgi:integrase/recombinase XerC
VDAVDAKPGPGRRLLEGYLTHLCHERRLSAHTCRNYEHAGSALLELNPGADLSELSPHAVRRTIARLHSRGLSGRTLAQMLSAWRGWYDWLARHHEFKTNPCAGIRAPKAEKRLPNALSPDEVAQLLDEPAGDLHEVRDKAMFELLYSSGLRLAELVGLEASQAKDIVAHGEVIVIGKGRKTRSVPVGAKAIEALRAWTNLRASLARPDEPALFVGSRGRRIGDRMVQARLARWAQKRGLGVGVHPHVLRHSFASHVLQSSGDLRAVQEMLGHASISTTQVYTHLDYQYLAKAYDAAHPRAKRKPK